MMRRLAPYAVLPTLLLLLLPGVASAHSVSHDTSINATRRPTGVVEPGTEVRIFGELSSPRQACITRSSVELHRRGDRRIMVDIVGRAGRFSFRVRVSETTRFRVIFDGKVLNANHPHSHTCEASSARVRVTTS
jgi:hypothetical protein